MPTRRRRQRGRLWPSSVIQSPSPPPLMCSTRQAAEPKWIYETMNNRTILNVWLFRSDSNPNKQYETLQFTDGSISCNCPGWTRRVSADGQRSCKHTRLVDMGRADSLCETHRSYAPGEPIAPATVLPAKAPRKPALGERKII